MKLILPPLLPATTLLTVPAIPLPGLALFTAPAKFLPPRPPLLLSSARPDFLRTSSSLRLPDRAGLAGSSLTFLPDLARGAGTSSFPDLALGPGADCLAVGLEMGGSLVRPALPERAAESLFLDSVRDVVWFMTPSHLSSLVLATRNIAVLRLYRILEGQKKTKWS